MVMEHFHVDTCKEYSSVSFGQRSQQSLAPFNGANMRKATCISGSITLQLLNMFGICSGRPRFQMTLTIPICGISLQVFSRLVVPISGYTKQKDMTRKSYAKIQSKIFAGWAMTKLTNKQYWQTHVGLLSLNAFGKDTFNFEEFGRGELLSWRLIRLPLPKPRLQMKIPVRTTNFRIRFHILILRSFPIPPMFQNSWVPCRKETCPFLTVMMPSFASMLYRFFVGSFLKINRRVLCGK